MSFRFIHCADIHLGAQLHHDIRYHDFFDAFSCIVDVAIERRVDAMLIAGDFFHQRSIDARTLSKASAELMRLKEKKIDVFAIEGNHDKAYYLDRQSWMDFLQEKGLLRLLDPVVDEQGYQVDAKKTVYEHDAVRLIGFGYLGSAAEQRIEKLAQDILPTDKPTILLLHAGINRLMNQDLSGIPKRALEPLKETVDYIALGHIHGRYEIEDWAFNPGAPENVHIDEAKHAEKGCYVVEIDSNGKQIEFVPIAQRPVHFVSVDISTWQADEELKAYVLRHMPEGVDDHIVSVSLCGTAPIQTSNLDLRMLEKEILKETRCLQVEVNSRIFWQTAQSESGHMTRKEMENQIFQQLADEVGLSFSDEAADVLQTLKGALLDKEDADTLIEYMESKMGDDHVD